ncbi:radical SAM/SPASM family putative metalloenzyme maturase [Maridesulfovibrio hydrothermalis]|uniref:Radical SAM domain protein n=1 Tax=Maridesulfovibrio hydrothermalis AM13 = DSM 14728 TaxID=1121451 RepID=L0RAD7_9BACT|nr:radical SAM/SPASM family putative metalloenzyme maturase [Maridesulfovibrio hydrothermalis]CCO23743.1 Radical SAM domain protein [Maridesulfovibrio hydrothermalis AM13 = DSM 14728]
MPVSIEIQGEKEKMKDLIAPAKLSYPTRLQVEVTTRCNMRCAMCVKSAAGSDIVEDNLNFEMFRKLGPALEHCEALVLNGIGEPLLNPELAEMAAFARKRMPDNGWIGFQTNGLLFTEEVAERLVCAGVDTFCISVDSLEAGGSGGELHGQTSVERLARTFALLRGAGEKCGRKINLGVEFVLMAETAAQLPAVIDWAAGQGAGFVIGSHVLAHDKSIQGQSLFNPNTRKATAIFDKWQSRAKESGLDLHDYYKIVWKFLKTEPEKILAGLVKRMLTEAKEQGIWVHFRSLLDWDKRGRSGDGNAISDIFQRAEILAVELGVELRLPPLMALDDLHCRFVEGGAAFVTSQGDVSPCQFLWHGYTCYLDGSEKQVKSRLFGNLAENDFAEIWRSASYADFRSAVLEYDYPYCSNCPLVPCDDIRGSSYDFEADCHGAVVPCGHCPWAMGGLQCLL